jgi:hypothetical protein
MPKQPVPTVENPTPKKDNLVKEAKEPQKLLTAPNKEQSKEVLNPQIETFDKKVPIVEKPTTKIFDDETPDSYLSSKVVYLVLGIVFILGLIFIGTYKYLLIKDENNLNQSMMTPVTKAPLSFTLDVNNPDDESLLFDNNLTVNGKTSPKSNVVVFTDETNQLLEADGNGSFSANLTLKKGLNNINVTAFDKDGNQKIVTRIVYYSEEKLP